MPFKSLEISNANAVVSASTKQSQFYKGFSTVDPTNYTAKLFDLDLITQDMLNVFYTRKGQRVMNPTFGTIIWDLLMEPLTPQVRESINADLESICNSDPRVIPTQINLVEYPTGYIIQITLQLKGTDVSQSMTLTYDQNVGLSVS
jgi:phage baseplate assembly protein W